MAPLQVLHEAMPGDHDPGATVLLEPSHRTKSCLQPAVIGLHRVVGIPLGAMPRRWQQLLQHGWIDRRVVSDDLNRPALQPQQSANLRVVKGH